MPATITAEGSTLEIKMSYRPMPKQNEFHGCPAKYRYFGGGVGNGKSSAGCVEGLTLALEYPGSVGMIARRTRPELKATTQHVFFNGGGGDPNSGDFEGCPQELIRKWNKTEGKLTLINGSIIHFWPLDDPDKLSNLNLGWFLIDQCEEVPEDMVLMLMGRLRQLNAPRCGLLLFNPNGHDWIWRRVVHLEYPNEKLIHATTRDNPNLPSDYIESLMQWPEAWRRRFMEGSFDVFTGQIWPEFDPASHTINPVAMEPWWECIETIDHGRRNPTAVLWLQFFKKYGHDYCFVVDEHYEKGKLVGHHAEKILQNRRLLGVFPNYTVIDASAAQQDPNTGRSVIDEYWDFGITTIPSDRHKMARINRVAQWLTLDPEVPHPLTGETREEGWPRLYIFKNCVELIEHVPQYQWRPQSPTKTEDAPEEALKKDDHDVDSLGYGLMTRPPIGSSPYFDVSGDAATQQYWDRYYDKIGSKSHGSHSMLGTEG